jgi:hypothetical protein
MDVLEKSRILTRPLFKDFILGVICSFAVFFTLKLYQNTSPSETIVLPSGVVDSTDLMATVEKKWEAGDYAGAATLLEPACKVLRSSPCYRNLGALKRLLSEEQLAFFYYLKATMLDSDNFVAASEYEQLVTQKHFESPVSLSYRIMRKLQGKEVQVLLILLWFMTGLLVLRVISRLSGHVPIRHIFRTKLGKACFIPALVALSLSVCRSSLIFRPQSVCLKLANLRSGPGERFLKLGQCSVGDLAQVTAVTQTAGDAAGESLTQQWDKVTLSGVTGWVENESLLEI